MYKHVYTHTHIYIYIHIYIHLQTIWAHGRLGKVSGFRADEAVPRSQTAHFRPNILCQTTHDGVWVSKKWGDHLCDVTVTCSIRDSRLKITPTCFARRCDVRAECTCKLACVKLKEPDAACSIPESSQQA